MGRNDRNWHPRFISYMNMIVNHPNYKGLEIKKKKDGTLSWIAPAESEIGQKRIEWCLNKAKELGLENKPGVYADVMLIIHPTKWKVCQTCGKEMSLYYHYPNSNFLKSLNAEFGTEFTDCDHISDIWDDLVNTYNFSEKDVSSFLIKKGGLNLNCTSTKDEIIDALEIACRKGGKKCLGPGAMSNFPDRFDGFHTYNRCCRSTQDTGRHKENLKSYTKDRRAYEYWSDGNIHAANQFMGSSFFKGTSADHIGPISLGFIHDPHYLQPMKSNDNSSKRDRLQVEDVEKIIETYNKTKVYPMSWFSSLIWDFIKQNYQKNKDKVPTVYRDALKQNMANFMYVLFEVLNKCPNNGENFLVKSFLEPNYKYFNYSYSFDDKGNIVSKEGRHFTGRNENETDRYRRIAINSVFDYNDKDNRHTAPDLTNEELDILNCICVNIENANMEDQKQKIIDLIEKIQYRAITKLLSY